MRRYNRIFQESQEYLQERRILREHKQLCQYIVLTEFGQREYLYEFSLPGKLKEHIDFIKQLATEIGASIAEMFKLFLNQYVFKFFSMIGWSFEKLYEMLQQGYKVYKDLIAAIKDYIAQHKITKWTTEALQGLDEFLQKHPKTRRIAGVALGFLVMYLWSQMTFVGNFDYDFDWNTIFGAMQGKIGFADIFGGADGIIFMGLVVTGLMKLTFPWPSPQAVKFIVAIIYTLAKKAKAKIKMKAKPQ